MASERAALLVSAIQRKSEAVREESIRALEALAPEAVRRAGLLEDRLESLPHEELVARFLTFSASEQAGLLSRHWEVLYGPDMLPVLRKLAEAAPPEDALSARNGPWDSAMSAWLQMWGSRNRVSHPWPATNSRRGTFRKRMRLWRFA